MLHSSFTAGLINLFLLIGCTGHKPGITNKDLLCENQHDPLGIGTASPYLFDKQGK